MVRDRISAGSKDWKKFEQNNKKIALNVLFVPHSTEAIRVAYRSEYNYKREKQATLLMTTGDNNWHYLVITNLSALLAKKSSNHDGDFYCLNCFNSYTIKNKLKEHEEICNNHDSCRIQITKWFEKILKYNPGEKSLKAPFAINLDLECLLKKNNLVKTISKNRIHRKKLSMSLQDGQCSQDAHLMKKKINSIITEEKVVLKNCKKLKERTMKIINYEEKK